MWEPMKPAPPVTRIRLDILRLSDSVEPFRCLRRIRARDALGNELEAKSPPDADVRQRDHGRKRPERRSRRTPAGQVRAFAPVPRAPRREVARTSSSAPGAIPQIAARSFDEEAERSVPAA